jgi:hypothetical protein
MDKQEKDKADKDKAEKEVPPPGAAAEPVKAATDKEAKPGKPEAKKDEAPSPAKTGEPAKPVEPAKPEAKKAALAGLPKPVEPAKLAVETKTVKPPAPMKAALAVKPVVHETKPAPLPTIMPRYVERRSVAPRPYRVKAKQPAKRPVTEAVKPEKPDDREVHWSYEGSHRTAALGRAQAGICRVRRGQAPIADRHQDGARPGARADQVRLPAFAVAHRRQRLHGADQLCRRQLHLHLLACATI